MVSQLDKVFCFEGLALLAMAAAALALLRRPDNRLPWLWLAMAALGQALGAWLGLSVVSGLSPQAVACVRLTLDVASYVAMLEFGRRGIDLALPAWICVPLLLLAGLGALSGQLAGIIAASRYVLALPGGLLAVEAVRRASRAEGQGERAGFRLLWQSMLVCTLGTGLIAPQAPFFPAAWLSAESFYAVAHFAVEWLVALGAIAATVGLARYYVHDGSMTSRPGLVRGWLFPGLCLLVVAIGAVMPTERTDSIVPLASQGSGGSADGAVKSGAADGKDNDQADLPVPEARPAVRERMNSKFLLTCLALVALIVAGVLADRWLHGQPPAHGSGISPGA